VELEDGAHLDVAVYLALRRTAGWIEPPAVDADVQQALDRTWNVIARDPEGDVVGIGRLLEDGALYATIWDMIVHPDRQGRGIGTMILQRLLAQARSRTIVALVATPLGRPLYERYGFRTESNGSVGMVLRPDQEPPGVTSS
jgi:GNAT superfamily N-acetyltransferase